MSTNIFLLLDSNFRILVIGGGKTIILQLSPWRFFFFGESAGRLKTIPEPICPSFFGGVHCGGYNASYFFP